jgi:hypothetical protein
MFSAIAALVGLLGFGAPGQTEERRFDVQGWRVTVSQDRFTGGVACRATRSDMSLSPSVIVFKLGRHVDTSNAVYRLDLGTAYSVVDQPVDLEVRHEIEVDAPLENPSAGVVALPLSQLAGVRRVDIRANLKSAPRAFDVSGVPAVLQFERTEACLAGSDQDRPTLTSAPAGPQALH